MNTEIRLASELVYQKEMRYWPRDRELNDRYKEGMPDERLTLHEIIDVMGMIAFCNALAALYDAGLSFSGCMAAMDDAIRRKYHEISSKEV